MTIKELKAIVDKQAKDDGLWATPFGFQPNNVAHLQENLRRLHAAIQELEEK